MPLSESLQSYLSKNTNCIKYIVNSMIYKPFFEQKPYKTIKKDECMNVQV